MLTMLIVNCVYR